MIGHERNYLSVIFILKMFEFVFMCNLQVEKEIRDDATRLLKSVLNFTRNVDDIQVS